MPDTSAQSTDDVLAAIIRNVESSGRLSAVRFEPGIHNSLAQLDSNLPLIEKIAGFNACNIDTAKIIFSSSFGLWQMMGFNVYSYEFDNPILKFWESELVQRSIYDAFIVRNDINFSWREMLGDRTKLEKFARIYNGPANVSQYISSMYTAARNL
jgi:hypothetical protein